MSAAPPERDGRALLALALALTAALSSCSSTGGSAARTTRSEGSTTPSSSVSPTAPLDLASIAPSEVLKLTQQDLASQASGSFRHLVKDSTGKVVVQVNADYARSHGFTAAGVLLNEPGSKTVRQYLARRHGERYLSVTATCNGRLPDTLPPTVQAQADLWLETPEQLVADVRAVRYRPLGNSSYERGHLEIRLPTREAVLLTAVELVGDPASVPLDLPGDVPAEIEVSNVGSYHSLDLDGADLIKELRGVPGVSGRALDLVAKQQVTVSLSTVSNVDVPPAEEFKDSVDDCTSGGA